MSTTTDTFGWGDNDPVESSSMTRKEVEDIIDQVELEKEISGGLSAIAKWNVYVNCKYAAYYDAASHFNPDDRISVMVTSVYNKSKNTRNGYILKRVNDSSRSIGKDDKMSVMDVPDSAKWVTLIRDRMKIHAFQFVDKTVTKLLNMKNY